MKYDRKRFFDGYRTEWGRYDGIISTSCNLEVEFMPRKRDSKALFWSRVDKSGECWLWLGHKNADGYGTVKREGRTQVASRYAYVITHGSVPDGAFVCHRCDNPQCVNPAHLFLGDALANNRDAIAKGRRRYARGTEVWAARLSGEVVKEICDLYATGDYSQEQLARRFGVAQGQVSAVVRGDSWTHVDRQTGEYGARRGKRGAANNQAKLSGSQVADIRRLYRTKTGRELAKQFGVSRGTISEIVRAQSWGDGAKPIRKRLTAEDVRFIRRARADGSFSARELAERFGVSTGAVYHIVRRLTWADLE